ncbi:MAG: lamin tail domain-containing protein [Bacteroidia bacterium]
MVCKRLLGICFLLIPWTILCGQEDETIVDFSQERGFYENSFSLTLTSSIPNATIRYSLDASDPMLGTALPYASPISIANTSIVRAIAFNATDTSTISTHTFIFKGDIIASGDLNPTYVNDPTYGPLLSAALSSLPSLSIVRPDADLITYDESETSLEWIPAGAEEGFQIDCGVHRYGGYFTNFAKRNFRLHFRKEYGPGKLEYPLFENDSDFPVDETFDQLDLRAGSHDMVLRGFYMSNGFTDKTMADMGHISPHGRYVHLYINGRYWGQYYLRERFGADFLATYQGGNDTLFEAINGNKNVGGWSPGTVYDGDGSQWADINALNTFASLNEVVDLSNYIDFILFYLYGYSENEYRCGGSDSLNTKFIFHLNDADGWLRSSSNYNLRGGPAGIWDKLIAENDPQFRQLLADRIHKQFFQNGALSASANQARLSQLSQEVELSMISECARWGYRTYDSWVSAKDAFLPTFNSKSTNVLNYLIQAGYYPSLDAVSYSQYGGPIPTNYQLGLSHTDPNASIYYTTDGSDPIPADGSINPQAVQYSGAFVVPAVTTDIRARTNSITAFNDLAEAKFAEQSSTGFGGLASRAVDGNTSGVWNNGSVAHTANEYQPWWQVDLGSPANITDIHLYNRTNCCQSRMSDFYILVSPDPFISDDLTTVLNQAGVRSYYQSANAGSPSIFEVDTVGQYVRVQLQGTNYINFAELEVFGSFQNGQIPGVQQSSAACPVRFYKTQDFSGLAINEILYHSIDTCGTEFIELKNGGSASLDLTDLYFNEGIGYTFPLHTVLAPDSFIVLARNPEEFESLYGFAPDGRYLGKLDNGGEAIVLHDPFGATIDSLRYNDKMPWDSLADGYGPSLELLNALADNQSPAYWVANPLICGTPRAENSLKCESLAPEIVINEIHYNEDDALSSLQTGDWVELYNPHPYAIDISDWQWVDEDTTFTFPLGTSISASSYLILSEDSNAFSLVHPLVSHFVELTNMGLDKQGEYLALRSSEFCPVDYLTYNDKSPWPTEADGDGFSLMLLDPQLANDKGENWTASTNYTGTPGQINADLCINLTDSVQINEINYRSNSGADVGDWVELYNASVNSLDLSGWEFHDGDNYFRFPAGTIISGEGFLVIAQDLFKFYSIFPNLSEVIGGWSFGLSGDGEHLTILSSSRCLVDQLSYNDSPPWPLEADGQGPTLALIDPSFNNEDPGNWAPSNWGNAPLGTPGSANNIPAPCSGTENQIIINEILYNSDPSQDSGNWLELYNPNSQSVDISGWLLMDQDSVFTIPNGTNIPAEAYLVIAEDITFFQNVYASIPSQLLGSSFLNFNNQGERLLLYTDSQCLIDIVEFDDKTPWPEATLRDPIIALLDQSLDNNQGINWLATDSDLGTPGSENVWLSQPGLGQQDLHLWLVGDLNQSDSTALSLWPDRSPQANDATQSIAGDEPYYIENVLNGHGAVRFDGTQDWLKVNGISTTLNEHAAIFAVFIPQLDTDNGYYLSTHLGGGNRVKLGHRTNGELIYEDDDPSLSTANYLDRPTMVSINLYPESIAKSWINGNSAADWTRAPSANADRASIGQEFDGSGSDNETSNHWKGELAELIVFKGTLNSNAQYGVETYLNIKYGINIPVERHLFYEHSAYPYGIAGIGKDIMQSLDQNSSQSADSSVLRLSNPSDLQQGEFLVWGHDNGSTLKADASQNVPVGIIERLSRIWRVQETGELGEVNLQFDLSDQAWETVDPRAWVILTDTDADFSDASIHPLSESIDLVDGQYFTLAKRQYITISAKIILSGAYDNSTQLMRDDLSSNNLIPTLDPYLQTSAYRPSLFSPNTADAIVDWVLVKLRDKNDPSQVLYQVPILLQRDGDIVDPENNPNFLIYLSNQSPIVASQEFHISIHHRNHLGVMSPTALAFGQAETNIDFTTQAGYGQDAQKIVAPATYGLWAGDTNGDGQIIFQGANNDSGRIFLDVLSATNNSAFNRNFILDGYYQSDTNLDGQVIFQGGESDISPLFINVLSYPLNISFNRNYVITQQIP